MTRKVYYGWWIVIASFLTLFVCAGIGFSTYPVFLKYLEADMQWNRTSLSWAGAIAALAAGLATPFVGWVIDRRGIRASMVPGAILLSAAYFLLGRIQSLQQLYILNLAVGLGMAGSTILPTQTLISRWFKLKRGRAMGIITMGSAVGSALWQPVSSRLIEEVGWRHAYEIFGILIIIISLPLILFVIRTSPHVMGLALEGRDDPPESAHSPGMETVAVETGYSMGKTLDTSTFWLIFVATFFVQFAQSGFGLHVIPFMSDSGLTMARATKIWATAQIVSIGGRYLFGYLSERYQKRYFASAANVSRALSVVLLILFAIGAAPLASALLPLVILYGLAMGCNAVMNPLIIGESFGTKSFGKVMGLLGIPYTIGMALGQVTGGRLFDWQKNYHLAFGVFASAFIVAAVAVIAARPCFLLDGASNADGVLDVGKREEG